MSEHYCVDPSEYDVARPITGTAPVPSSRAAGELWRSRLVSNDLCRFHDIRTIVDVLRHKSEYESSIIVTYPLGSQKDGCFWKNCL